MATQDVTDLNKTTGRSEVRRPGMAMRTTAATLAIAFAVAGCTTIDPVTGERKTSNTIKGIAIGTVLGAGVGAAVGWAGSVGIAEGALIGAGAGLVAGGAVGYYMDRQERDLQRRLGRQGLSLNRIGNNLNLMMPSDFAYAHGSDTLRPEARAVLSEVAAVVGQYDQTVVRVNGHTDGVEANSFDTGLSDRRAHYAALAMADGGVAPGRIVVAGHGASKPVASDRTVDGRASNRRIEIEIMPVVRDA